MKYLVCVGGSPQARERWPTRHYKHKCSAWRRARQIKTAEDLGVETIWVLPAPEESSKGNKP